MDGHKFDTLTRAFATGTNRRSLLKLFGGATAAGVAGVALSGPARVFAQDCTGDGSPGACCMTVDDCNDGLYCVIQGDVGAQGLCACTQSGIGDPWLGCVCTAGTQNPCGDSNNLCCGADTPGGEGTCAAQCDEPTECSALQTMCEDTDCCAEGTTCGANGWCYGCYSGTEDPCGPYAAAFGGNFICCTYGDDREGAVGYCVTQDECVVAPPNTGAGTTADTSTWIAPAAAIGAAAAVMAFKGRDKKSETEA